MFDITSEESARNSLIELDTQLSSVLNDRQRADVCLGRALCYGKLRKFDLALKALEDASQLVTDDFSCRLELEYITGTILHQEGNITKAYQLLTSVLLKYSNELKHPNLRFVYEDIQVQRGFELVALAKFEDAIVLLKEVLAYEIREDDRSAVLAKLGLCYLNLKEFESAKNYLLQASKREQTPNQEGQIHFQLGIVYAHLRLLDESRRELLLCEENAFRWNLSMRNVYGWLYRVHKKLGLNTKAEEYLRFTKQPE